MVDSCPIATRLEGIQGPSCLGRGIRGTLPNLLQGPLLLWKTEANDEKKQTESNEAQAHKRVDDVGSEREFFEETDEKEEFRVQAQ